MNYENFAKILNEHLFSKEKNELLKKIADWPERFIGLFRPTKPGTKVLQNLLQSHEIRFGDALEELIKKILRDWDYTILDKNITNEKGENLSIDQYFSKLNKIYFVEQKVRDDHDSTKKRGQISNFETKLEILYKKHGKQLTGIMYFIDPDLSKNKNFYEQEITRLSSFYDIEVKLFYGEEFFEYLKNPKMWDDMLLWLKQWKKDLPEIPEVNCDKEPLKSFEELKELELRYWRKILENEKLWEEGIIKVIFREGKTLKLLLEFFNSQNTTPYKRLYDLLKEKLSKYFSE
ncbi:MAG: restriction endonuclease [Elusimicrobia bacterium]|nr:restriction endonuclease [Elusimicrobiota bacterium]